MNETINWTDRERYLTEEEVEELRVNELLCQHCKDGEIVWCPIGVEMEAPLPNEKIEITICCSNPTCVYSREVEGEELLKSSKNYFAKKYRRYRTKEKEIQFQKLKRKINKIEEK